MVTSIINNTSLNSLKTWQLKYGGFLLGLGTTGSRAVLKTAVAHRLAVQLCPQSETTRIASVDMGIRNLAFCVLEVPGLSIRGLDNADRHATNINVKSWKRLDLLDTLARSHGVEDSSKLTFTPSIMSTAAYDTVQLLLKHSPDVILIEQQRFRSGGGAAIQEWTVRVNMLESMLWACLKTLSHMSQTEVFPSIYQVNPAKVANFWLASSASSRVALRPRQDIFAAGDKTREQDRESVQLSRTKVEKKDKIAVAKAWIRKDADHILSNEVDMHFHGQAAEVAEAFRTDKKRIRRTGSSSPVEERIGKLDDLADCLLQGAAWIRWTENCRELKELLRV
nr:cruciform cutting endonuclease 1, mitochondrial [Quercus suber]